MPTAGRRARFVAAVAGLALMAAACDRGDRDTRDAATAPAPVATADTTSSPAAAATPAEVAANNADLQRWLQATYGHAARLDRPWRNGDGRERQVCARGGSPDANTWPSLLAVCTAAGDAGGAATIDFFALERTPTGLRASAQARDVDTGGNAVGLDVDIARFGRERWGFLDHGGFTSQGIVIGWRTLRVFRAGRLEELGTVNTAYDNGGAACDAPDCTVMGISLDAELLFDASDAQAGMYPLRVHRYGFECGQRVDNEVRYEFDAGRFRYPVPEGPPEVVCPPVEAR